MAANTGTSRIRVGIIGGGITGVILALALEKRAIDYTIFERAAQFTEIGAGIGFSPNAERALKVVDPEVYKVYKEVASTNDQEDVFTWIDGLKTNQVFARLPIGIDAFQGGRRSDFLEAWSDLIPKGRCQFGKEGVSVLHMENGKVQMKFKDGTTAEADIVIGSDGIHSRVRKLLLGEANPASYPSYTNKYCFRALVPMEDAREILGEERTTNRFMYNGPGAHMMVYPVAMGVMLNILLVISDPNPWRTADGRHTAKGDKKEAIAAFARWHPKARAIVDLLPEDLDKWAIFDMYEHPAPYYNRGSVAIAGDAAHASGPHLGSGAGFGIEDALVLASVISAADQELEGGTTKKKDEVCSDALAAYNSVRYRRTQWLVGATRESCSLFQQQNKEMGTDPDKFLPEITRLFHTIWNNDIDKMVEVAVKEFSLLASESPKISL
ncbi:hypothetical protein F4778DRAFT_244627 [Xylariomycetidae sp. FL2044]|nr:hypothetical protein F4778DRAFT_244627 [Xylariomycetidae sp. FL2044]